MGERTLCRENIVPGGSADSRAEHSSHSELILPLQNFLGIGNTQGHPVGRGDGTLMCAEYES